MNNKSLRSEIEFWIGLIANLLTIVSLLITGVINFFKTKEYTNIFGYIILFIFKNWVVILIVYCIIRLVFNIWIAPFYRVKKGIPVNEAKSSKILTIFLCGLILILCGLKFGNITNLATFTELPIEKTEDVNKEDVKEENENNENNENNLLDPEQVLVNYYVPLCKQETYSIEFWQDFTNNELYYILNGIYAYEGMKFPGDYFNTFSWYNGYIEPKNFTDDMLCYYQHKNIANIIDILEERGLR